MTKRRHIFFFLALLFRKKKKVFNTLSLKLVPRAFLRQGEGGREKTLSSADHVISKHPEKLGVIIEHFIRGQEFRRKFKDLSAVKASFPNIPVMVLTETAQPHLLKRLNVIYYTQLF